MLNVSYKLAQDIRVQAKAEDAKKETPTNGLAPISSKEKDPKKLVLIAATKAVQNPEIIKRANQSKISKWSDDQRNSLERIA